MPLPSPLPVAVIGAGPVGLAAAAHLIARGLPVVVYEAGETAGANVRDWGHVRLFSPWGYDVDAAARTLLERHGWKAPCADGFPTGAELYARYLKPLAETPEIASVLETRTRVVAIGRQGADKMSSRDRATKPFTLRLQGPDGRTRRELARAVIDASGTWTNPNPLGAGGLPADGEAELADRIAYGAPDVRGRDRALYAGRSVLVVGAGHSAANVILDLMRLADEAPGTAVTWVTRGSNLTRVYGGGQADGLPARGELGASLRALVEEGRLRLEAGFSAQAVRAAGDGVALVGDTAEGEREIGPADRIVVATGQRPDLALTRELRLELDPWIESAKALGPLIDPNLHSCGSVKPHGHRALAHPEPGFYTLGIKSYGRAPTFLMLTGYEQARSVAAALAGDLAAADRVHLVLPETGVCSSVPGGAAAGDAAPECCGGPAPAEADACCAADAAAKAASGRGCGCGTSRTAPARVPEPA
ncbi:MAG TPA: FAD-dependent oxidoreductase [Microvirga sp.]|jgi:thioredoxin reductase|nr:FAD-dependent oxidoreductase [Microvirga sp.]